MATLGQLETEFNVQVFDHLARDAEVPTVTTVACQGDVSILRVTTEPAVTPIPATGVAVVAGENGGNTHSLHGTAFFDATTAARDDLTLGTLTVPAGSTAYLLHPEHGGIQITPGTYRIGRQREWTGKLARERTDTWRTVED